MGLVDNNLILSLIEFLDEYVSVDFHLYLASFLCRDGEGCDLAVSPCHVDGKAASGTHACDVSVLPVVGQGREEGEGDGWLALGLHSVTALDEHLNHAGATAEVAVNLEW